MGMVYSWKPGAHHSPAIEAQVAGEELERIRVRNNGRLENADVVDAARDKKSPLHPAFEWDDKKAASAYRLDQAGYLIRSIDVVITKDATEPKPIRAFVSVKRDADRSYTSVQHALSDDELRAQVVAAAWAELEAWRKRHAELVELAEIFAAMDQARAA
ncbi:hypothetical protein [Sphingopyxis sp. 113P3]|uniref:hypothetical protein n=1 Tax=Sphingopyxis sp. (strain 113P3) TaxID=292913 RepID=UPI0006AD0D64|nr:hypothetical protein [Sphingopyxis sp. 113P3]ALC12471.1 hypothetical protein LH20_10965 [Sphingopyxis sp. 113P3]